MKKISKFLSLLLVAAMLAATFTACGGSAPAEEAAPAAEAKAEEAAPAAEEKAEEAAPAAEASGDDVTVNFFAAMYSDGTEGFLREAFDKFEAENPGIKVSLEIVGWDTIGERAVSLIGSNQAPDIMNGNGYSGYADDDLLYKVEDIMSPELIDDMQPDFYTINRDRDGNVVALPYLASVRNLYYSKPIFEEVGIAEAPKTWKEVEEACQKIQDYYNGEVYPWGLDATMTEGQTLLAYYGWNNGGGFVDDNDQWILNCPENVEGLEWVKKLYDAGYTNVNPAIETRDDQQKLFAEGKMAMLLTANFFPTLYPDLDLGIAALPYNDANISQPYSLGVQDGVCFFNDTAKAEKDTPEKLEAVKKVMEYFYSPDVYVDYMLLEGMLPATKSGAKLLVERDPSKQGFVDSLSSCRFYPQHKAIWGATMGYVAEAGQNVLSGAMTAQEALDYIQELVVEDEEE